MIPEQRFSSQKNSEEGADFSSLYHILFLILTTLKRSNFFVKTFI